MLDRRLDLLDRYSPDSDIFFILLHYAQKLRPLTILFDTGSGKNRRLFKISDIAQDLGPRYCQSLLGIYLSLHLLLYRRGL